MDSVLSGSALYLGGNILNKYVIKKISALQKYLSKPSREGIKAILAYHGVSIKEKKNCVSLKKFISHLDYLNNFFEIIKLSELIDLINLNTIDGRNHVAITFDDAYQNFWQYAYPELKRRNIPAALFVPVGFVGLYNAWDFDNRHVNGYLKIMNWEELQKVDINLIEIGSHGYNHKRLAQLRDNELEIEIRKTKEILEYKLKYTIEGFAYPYGELFNLDERAIRILIDSGYGYGLTTHFGRRNEGMDLYRLNRISIWDDDEIGDISDKLSGYYDWLGPKEKFAYYIRRILK